MSAGATSPRNPAAGEGSPSGGPTGRRQPPSLSPNAIGRSSHGETAISQPARPGILARLAVAVRREYGLFLLGIGVIGVHVLDDNLLQPQPGTSAGEHLVSGLVPLAVLMLAAAVYPRLRAGFRAVIALSLGFLAVVGGAAEAGYYTVKVGASGDDYTGLLMIAAGALLIAVGVWTLWRTRRLDESRRRRYPRRFLIGVVGFVVFFEVVLSLAFSYVYTHAARPVVPEAALGAPYEEVTFATSDGLELAGWYIASRNGAAVIAFPGRKGPQPHARMLARTATAFSSSTAAARAKATATPTRSAGPATGTSRRRSPSSATGRTSIPTASAASASPSAARCSYSRQPNRTL